MVIVGAILFIVIVIRLFTIKARHEEIMEKLDELNAALSRLEQARGEQEQAELKAAVEQLEQVQGERDELKAGIAQLEQAERERDELKAALLRLEQAQGERKYTEDAVRPRKLSDKPGNSARVRSARNRQLNANRG